MARSRSRDSDTAASSTDEVRLAAITPETREAMDAGRVTATTYEEGLEAGYIGSPSDPRPNEHYQLDNEPVRAEMVAEGKSPDRPPSREQVGPPRRDTEAILADAPAVESGGTE